MQAAERIEPKQALVHANLGAVYMKQNKLADATKELTQAVGLDPRNAATQASLGRALLLAGDAARAAKAYGFASSLAPEDAELKYNEALALLEAKDLAGAKRVLATVPADAMTDQMQSLAADVAERSGDFKEALTHLQAAAQSNPSDANIFAVIAELLRHWTWDEAVRVAKYGAEKYPGSNHFKLAEGIAYYGKGDYVPAVKVFSAQLQADPENATVADLLGRSCAALQDGENTGCDAVYEFAQRHPGNAVMTMYAAVAILHEPATKQDLGKAAELLQALIAADPKYSEAYLQLGVLEQMRQRWPQSAASLEQSIALNPTAAEAHYRLSRAYAHMGRREDAQREVALHQTYADQAKQRLDSRLAEVMRFVLSPG